MARLASLLALYARLRGGRRFEIDYIDELIARKDVSLPDGDYETKLFVHGVNLFNAIVEERELAPIFRSEELTSDPGVFADFARLLTGGHVSIRAPWVERGLRPAPV